MSSFTITDGKGFRITFENGWTVSVQFGVFNYCEHHDSGYAWGIEREAAVWASKDAEVAIIKPNGKWLTAPGGDSVIPCQTPDQVAAIIAAISKESA